MGFRFAIFNFTDFFDMVFSTVLLEPKMCYLFDDEIDVTHSDTRAQPKYI